MLSHRIVEEGGLLLYNSVLGTTLADASRFIRNRELGSGRNFSEPTSCHEFEAFSVEMLFYRLLPSTNQTAVTSLVQKGCLHLKRRVAEPSLGYQRAYEVDPRAPRDTFDPSNDQTIKETSSSKPRAFRPTSTCPLALSNHSPQHLPNSQVKTIRTTVVRKGRV